MATVLASLIFVQVLPAYAQPSPCPHTGPAGSLVCRNPALTGLADELDGLIRQFVRFSERLERRNVIREQRDWNFGLRDCLDGADTSQCLTRAYETRISELGARLADAMDIAGSGALPDPDSATALLEPANPAGDGAPGASPDQSAVPQAIATREAGSQSADEIQPGAFTDGSSDVTVRSLEGTELDGILTTTVWKADIATGIRPGTIFIFHENGALVTADCVESYKLGSWSLSPDSKLVLDNGSGDRRSAEIVTARDSFVRLQIDGSDDRRGTLVLRPAISPFSCKSS